MLQTRINTGKIRCHLLCTVFIDSCQVRPKNYSFFFYFVHSIWTNLIISVIIFSINVLINKAMTKNTIFFHCKFPFFDNIRPIIHWYSRTIWFLKTLYHIIELFSIFAPLFMYNIKKRYILIGEQFLCEIRKHPWRLILSWKNAHKITMGLFFL